MEGNMKKSLSFKLDTFKLNFPQYLYCFDQLLQGLSNDASHFLIKSFSVSPEKKETNTYLVFNIDFYDVPVYEDYITGLKDRVQKQFNDALISIE